MSRRYAKNLPTVWLMTDERIGPAALLRAVVRLTRGKAGIIFRHYRTDPAQRRTLFGRVRLVARRRRLVLLLAGPSQQAVEWKADGWHGVGRSRSAKPLIHSMAAHNAREMIAAKQAAADLVVLSPLFATRSHPGGRVLGRARFAALAHSTAIPVMALGGVRTEHRRTLSILGASGWAAIDGLSGSNG